MLESLFGSILRISMTTGIIILAVIILSSRLNRRYVAAWKYWLWLLLAVRMLVPITFALPNPPVQVSFPDEIVNAPVWIVTRAPTEPFVPGAAGAAQFTAARTPLSVMGILGCIWLLGVAVFLIWQISEYFICKRRLMRWARCPVDARINVALEKLCTEMYINRGVTLLISPKSSSPMMIGLLRAYLILPQEDYDETDLVYILRHELVHLKRHDLWYKLLMLLVGALHWFNPAAHLLMREAGKDLEIACDDAVISRFGTAQRQEYGDAILRTIHKQVLRSTMLSTSFSGNVKTLRERLAHILGRNKKRNGILLGALILVCAAAIGSIFAFNSAPKAPLQWVTSDIALAFSKPDRWTLREHEAVSEPFAMFALPSALDIVNNDGEIIGIVGYNIYEEYEGAKDDPRAIYNQIALGNNYQFDVRDSYTVINETESGAAAICDVRYSANINNGAEKTNKGIVAYNRDLPAYVAFEFDAGKVTDEQIKSIAASIELTGGSRPIEGQGLSQSESREYYSDLSPEDEALYQILTKERGLQEWQVHSLSGTGLNFQEMIDLPDEEIARILAPGSSFMGDYMTQEEFESLVASGMPEEDVYVLMALGYDYVSAVALSPQQLDFIFPNTELVDNLVAVGYDRNIVDAAGHLSVLGGYDTYKDLLDEVFANMP